MIAHYAPRRHADSADGITIGGSAYGARLFTPPRGGGRSPYNSVLRLLREETDSKRAFLPVYRPADLGEIGAVDVPCLVGLQLAIRAGRLHMVAHMRANDADRGMLADVFSFTFIQEFTARLLRLRLGSYTHQVSSMHVAQADVRRVRRVLDQAAQRPNSSRSLPMTMPRGTDWRVIRQLLECEAEIRGGTAYTPSRIAEIFPQPYWQQVLLLFEAHRQLKEHAVSEDILAALIPSYRALLEARWPARTDLAQPLGAAS
jgi:thymidylate synthase